MINILLFIGSIVLISDSYSQDLSDLSIKYSDLSVKCISVDKSINVDFNNEGDIYRSENNTVSWAIHTTQHLDWYFSNKSISTRKQLFNRYNSYNLKYKDPFGYEYEVNFEKMTYFSNGKSTRAILSRAHKHPEINTIENFELECKTSVNITSVALKPVTAESLVELSDKHKAYVLANIAYVGVDYLDDINLSIQQQERFEYYFETGHSESIIKIDELHNLTNTEIKLLKSIHAKEAQDVEICIENVLDMYDLDEEQRDDILFNWSVCSFEMHVVYDSNKKLIGILVDRYNDNGVDDTDGHDSSISILDQSGHELFYGQWNP